METSDHYQYDFLFREWYRDGKLNYTKTKNGRVAKVISINSIKQRCGHEKTDLPIERWHYDPVFNEWHLDVGLEESGVTRDHWLQAADLPHGQKGG